MPAGYMYASKHGVYGVFGKGHLCKPLQTSPELSNPLKVVDVPHVLLHHLVHHIACVYLYHDESRQDDTPQLGEFSPHKGDQISQLWGGEGGRGKGGEEREEEGKEEEGRVPSVLMLA